MGLFWEFSESVFELGLFVILGFSYPESRHKLALLLKEFPDSPLSVHKQISVGLCKIQDLRVDLDLKAKMTNI